MGRTTFPLLISLVITSGRVAFLSHVHSRSIIIGFNSHDPRLLHAFTSRVEKSVDPDQLASEKPADLDLHCFQNRIYPGSA